MITTEEILNMNFYKKEKFTGSYKGMRYLVKKDKDDAENDIFRATVWPGPYNFATTPDDQKISATFPFSFCSHLHPPFFIKLQDNKKGTPFPIFLHTAGDRT